MKEGTTTVGRTDGGLVFFETESEDGKCRVEVEPSEAIDMAHLLEDAAIEVYRENNEGQ